jgi:poly(3-hydroxybutyrate) depolymerase
MLDILGPFVALALFGGTPLDQPARGTVVEHVSCPTDPTQTYSLYLPSTYVATRRWPLLIVFDPAGRGARAADVFREAAERFGWIVAASENSRNGPWEPTLRAMNAMWPALLGGYAVDERRVYTAGHSGGATVAWMIAQQTGQIAGLIASDQPNPGSEQGKRPAFAWFGAAGHSDFNKILDSIK